MIPVFDPRPEIKSIRAKLDKAYARVMDSGVYLMGDELTGLEAEVKKQLSVPFAVGVGSGTAALTLALRALHLPKDAEIIMPANAYPTYFGVQAAGFKVVPADVDPQSLQLTIASVSERLSAKTAALVVVHLYGQNSLSAELERWLRENDVKIVEDVAQAFGAKADRMFLGTRGDIGIFSFYPTKPVGTYGDGGLVITKDPTVAEHVQRMRQYGESGRYNSVEWGTNSRLSELSAAFLRVKLPRQQKWRQQRRSLAQIYHQQLTGVGDLRFPAWSRSDWEAGAHHLLVLLTPQRDKLQRFLQENDIGTLIHYPVAVTQIDWAKLGRRYPCPVAESTATQLLSLPLYNGLSKRSVYQICQIIKEFYRQ